MPLCCMKSSRMDLEVDLSVMLVGLVLEDVDEDELVELDRAVVVDVAVQFAVQGEAAATANMALH
eukprot:4616453-Amphidinium_carterae.1